MSFYYLNDSNQPVGPMDLSAIHKLAEAGVVREDVLVCEAGHEDWMPLSEKVDPSPLPAGPLPPRTAPPPRSTARMTSIPAERPANTPPVAKSTTYQEWFPLASMVAGIASLVALCVPALSFLLAAPAMTLGILALRQDARSRKPFAVTGISAAAVALVVSLGIFLLGLGGGAFGSPAKRYVGSWQIDMSVPIMATQWDHAVMITLHPDGRFTEVTGMQVRGGNFNTGSAARMAGGQKTTGFWEWNRGRKAIVTRHDGRNSTIYMDGDNSDGRSLHTGPMNSGSSTGQSGDEFWVLKPDPDDHNSLIGVHPTLYHNRTMRFHRLN